MYIQSDPNIIRHLTKTKESSLKTTKGTEMKMSRRRHQSNIYTFKKSIPKQDLLKNQQNFGHSNFYISTRQCSAQKSKDSNRKVP